jgi:hypothetical protein
MLLKSQKKDLQVCLSKLAFDVYITLNVENLKELAYNNVMG